MCRWHWVRQTIPAWSCSVHSCWLRWSRRTVEMRSRSIYWREVWRGGRQLRGICLSWGPIHPQRKLWVEVRSSLGHIHLAHYFWSGTSSSWLTLASNENATTTSTRIVVQPRRSRQSSMLRTKREFFRCLEVGLRRKQQRADGQCGAFLSGASTLVSSLRSSLDSPSSSGVFRVRRSSKDVISWWCYLLFSSAIVLFLPVTLPLRILSFLLGGSGASYRTPYSNYYGSHQAGYGGLMSDMLGSYFAPKVLTRYHFSPSLLPSFSSCSHPFCSTIWSPLLL